MHQPDQDSQAQQSAKGGRAAIESNPIMQRDNERYRLVLDGRRTDDGTRCALVVIQEHSGGWAFYPHGAGRLGARVSGADASALAKAIVAGES